MAPIKIEQTALNKFCPSLPEGEEHELINEINRRVNFSTEDGYHLRLERDGTVEIIETHCLEGGTRLSYNGYNDKLAILDHGLGRYEFSLHRKICPKCGDIDIEYSQLAPKYGNYHENYKKRARQHYMNGLMPEQIAKVFHVDFGIDIARSTIQTWIDEAAEPLRETLKETPIPSSGTWGYDEIHLKVGGEKMYALNTVDLNTEFIPAAKVSESMGKAAGRDLLREARCHAELELNALLKDGTANLGALFKTRSFKNVTLQDCLTHIKWSTSKHIKAFIGLPTQSTKPVPPEWQWLVKRFYDVINPRHETDAYIKLEVLRNTLQQLNGERIDELYTAYKTLKTKLPKIIAHQRNPQIPATNNLLEGYHKKFEYYPSFKRNMMTPEGVQRVLDYITFRHNFKKFPGYIAMYEAKYERWRERLREGGVSDFVRGQGNHFRWKFIKLKRWYKKYLNVWNKYFKIV